MHALERRGIITKELRCIVFCSVAKKMLGIIAGVAVLVFCLPILGLAAMLPADKNSTSSAHSLFFLGSGRGTWDASVGMFFWNDTFSCRNLQVRGDMDLFPGVRWHSIVRSNRSMNTLGGFHPYFDENYLEGYDFYHSPYGTLSASLRIGTIRYLHFPYPDAIALFDQVPSISDLRGGEKTGYQGELLTLEYAQNNGLGLHVEGIRWGFGRSGGTQVMEDYLFYRHDIGTWHIETRCGGLAVRTEPLGQRANGYDVFVGPRWKGNVCGLLYEKLANRPAYTGVMVSFPLDHTTKALGRVAFDYDRTPQGFAMQLPLVKGVFGGIRTQAPQGAELVGEIKAERLRTYWQNGQARNYYEHRLSSWGETGNGLIVVMEEQPWYLQAEALVSPHSSGNLKTWERDREGPAQLSQTVIYKFYRMQ